jgi:hypothetical protein
LAWPLPLLLWRFSEMPVVLVAILLIADAALVGLLSTGQTLCKLRRHRS